MDYRNIFNKKKTHAIYHSDPLFEVCCICLLSLIYIDWVGSFLKNFQKGGEGTI